MSVMAGFFGELADGMGEKRAFIRDRVEQRSAELRRMGMERQAEVQNQRQAYETAADRLMRMEGVDQGRILAALESDPDSVVDVYRRVEANPDITGEVINNFYNVYDSSPSVGTVQEALEVILPISQQSVAATNDPAERETRTFAAMLGLDVDAALDDQVYNAEVVGNMTGDQILAMGTGGVRARGQGEGRQLDYSIFSDAALYPESNNYSISERGRINDRISSGYMGAASRRVQELESQRDAIIQDESIPLEEREAQALAIGEEISSIEELVTSYPDGGTEFVREAQEMFGTEIETRIFDDFQIDRNVFYGITSDGEEPVPEEQPDLPGLTDESITVTDLPPIEEDEVVAPVVEDETLVVTQEEAESPTFADDVLRTMFEDDPELTSVSVSVKDGEGSIVDTILVDRGSVVTDYVPGSIAERVALSDREPVSADSFMERPDPVVREWETSEGNSDLSINDIVEIPEGDVDRLAIDNAFKVSELSFGNGISDTVQAHFANNPESDSMTIAILGDDNEVVGWRTIRRVESEILHDGGSLADNHWVTTMLETQER